MTTDRSILPQWKGHPVPWVARWSNEVIREPYGIMRTRDGTMFGYHDGNEFRDGRGILWQREGLNRGGEPKFAQVNTYRQRSAMRKCRCQVCGAKITERPIRWLMPLHEGWGGLTVIDGETLTTSAPTCSECIPLALELCPHFKAQGHQILKVLDYSVWGVFAETIIDGRRKQMFLGHETDYGPGFSWNLVFAKQQIVRLDKFVVEETHLP